MKRLFARLCLCAALLATPALSAADVVLDWNDIMLAVMKDELPPLQNRLAAITQLAVFKAVDAMSRTHKPSPGAMPDRAGASADAAVVAAAHHVLRHYFPDRAADLDGARARSLAAVPDGPAKDAGIAAGEAAAAEIVAARQDDGAERPEFFLPSSTAPGEWQLTPDCPPQGGVLLHWRNVEPFVIRRADQFRLGPPPRLISSKYARDYQEVKASGARDSSTRPPDRAEVVRLYAAASDAQLWNRIAAQLSAAKRLPLRQNARLFAVMNIALHDAGVAVLDTKYHYRFWRPETAIAAAHTDGNDRTEPDPSFVPFIAAPCFPGYPSGHAATSYAAREVLERFVGKRGHSITVSSPDVPDVSHAYTTLREITEDIDDARVYGGIHFRFDQEGGAEQGRALGAYVYRHALRPARRCRCEAGEPVS